MAACIYSILLLLTVMLSCKADITQQTVKAYNYSMYQEISSENGTETEEIYEVSGVRWQKQGYGIPDIRTKWYDEDFIASLPADFDPRDKWPSCESLSDVYDQGACGSCWVFGSVPAITDRICIASNGTKSFYASPEDALTCSRGGNCRDGGISLAVYMHWKYHGIVSGGAYNTRDGCKPYSVPPCRHHVMGLPCPPNEYIDTPKCRPHCDTSYRISYENDKEFASEVYRIEGEGNIKAELYLNGPVTASMGVFEDFLTHKCGVYRYRQGRHWYGHAVKLMGWGVEDGVKYWLAANSWNVGWGEKGFFKIVRGVNDCDIESFVIAGVPKV